MKYRLVVYGLLAVAMALAWSVERGAYRVDDTTEILIVANPINPLNPVVKNPYQEEYEKLLYPTVRITAGYSTGSGVVISVERRALSVEGIAILTVAHVVENQSIVDIELYDSTNITGTVVITDTIKDIALIKAEISTDSKTKIYTAELAPENYEAYLFSPVWAIGCSLGLEPRPSQGIISAINLRTEGLRSSASHIEISAPILPGNSGGPVFDARTYEVIGIAVWVKVYDGQLVTTMAGIVPIKQIYEFLNETTNGH